LLQKAEGEKTLELGQGLRQILQTWGFHGRDLVQREMETLGGVKEQHLSLVSPGNPHNINRIKPPNP
jgi:hypothetical protein